MNTKKIFEYLMRLHPMHRSIAVLSIAKSLGVKIDFNHDIEINGDVSMEVLAQIEEDVAALLK